MAPGAVAVVVWGMAPGAVWDMAPAVVPGAVWGAVAVVVCVVVSFAGAGRVSFAGRSWRGAWRRT
ncbi:hypothetical protein, partial [Streptomyces sp. NPDC057176]|uniref:hypothetical protein n=1 Tax=Streptomyces sp. NPDC057176 TaxID=3346036 RepID=UPI0036252621